MHQKKSKPAPLTVEYARCRSEEWTPERLEYLLRRPLHNAVLSRIENRRRVLNRAKPLPLHESYADINAAAGKPFVTPETVSLPCRYGRILYSIAADIRPRYTLEAGAGLGMSGMYLAAAAGLRRNSKFVSFEISDYAEIAEESIQSVMPTATVYQDEFENFPRYLDASTLVDFCFLDAKHDHESVVRNVKSLIGWMSVQGVVVIDDVSLTSSSRSAWEHIMTREDFRFAACIHGRFGFLAR